MKLLLFAIIYPISLTPFWILHRYSEWLAFWVWSVAGYRKKIVKGNLERSFPEKSAVEINRLAKAYYIHLFDLIFESFKTFTISKAELQKRFVFQTPEVARDLKERLVNITGVASHYNSWEWQALDLAMQFYQIGFGVYKPLNNKVWDEVFFQSRTRFGIRMIPIKKVREVLDTPFERPIMMGLLCDQAPHDYDKAFEIKFLNQKTYVTPGPALITIQRGFTPIWGWVRKVSRSRYEWGIEELKISAESIAQAATDVVQVERIARVHSITQEQAAYGLALTLDYSARLEAEIKMAPQFWLWSHRRWKSRS